MRSLFYNLHVESGNPDESVAVSRSLGWHGVCIARPFDHAFRSFASDISELQKKAGIEVLTGALISPKDPADVLKKAKDAVEQADIVLVEGGDEEINRAASECWEVDILCTPEKISGKDLLDQKNSGIDHVTARFMSERCIALEVNFSELLYSYGMQRSQVMARMRQNVMLAKKYGTPLVMTSGAIDKHCLRSPRDLLSVGLSLGMDEDLARKALTDHPARIVKKSRDRADPNKLLAGLDVKAWGSSEGPKRKKMSGWY